MYSVNLPEVPHDLYKYLLDSHWTWIQPLYNMVYRPAFVRDMGDNPEGGQYFSPFLLHAILAHSTRFCRDQPAMAGYEGFSDYFWRKARTMLVEELDKASTVATVQGLLLLSAIENSRGNVSQSWTYSGMAFRMLQDLGIHLDGASQASDGRFSEEDLEVRRRLWWSAFLWDKMISIYFGRTPTLQDSPLAPPTILVDDSTESEPWIPIGAADTSLTLGGVPGVPGHGVSCFVAACRMAEVLHRVLMRHYCDSTARAVVERQDRDLMRDTIALLEDLAPHLRARPDAFAPHHIIVLNCLIHAVIVLAHRPFCPAPGPGHSPSPATCSAMKACMASARAINGLAENIRRTYGVCKFAAVGYSLWTAATVFVLDIKSSRPATATDSMSQLDVSRELLNGVAQFCPGIRQAIIALDNQIDHLLPDRTRSDNVSGFVDPSAFLPAVPQSQLPVAPVGDASNLVTDFGQAPDLLSELFHSGFLTQTPFQ